MSHYDQKLNNLTTRNLADEPHDYNRQSKVLKKITKIDRSMRLSPFGVLSFRETCWNVRYAL